MVKRLPEAEVCQVLDVVDELDEFLRGTQRLMVVVHDVEQHSQAQLEMQVVQQVVTDVQQQLLGVTEV